MTADLQRLMERAARVNGRECYELAVTEIRRRMVEDCRGMPLTVREIEAAMKRVQP